MKFGMAIVNDAPPGTTGRKHLEDLRQQVREAKRSGMESVWLLHHYLGNMETLAPIPLMGYLAHDLDGMDIGTNMFILPLSHPVEVAESFATLDHLTDGHVIAGFGMGYRPNEFEAFGISMDDRKARYEESIRVIRGLWSGEPVSFRGEHFAIDNEKLSLPPVRPGGPPIYIGSGVHKAGARRAAELGDVWLVPPHANRERLKQITDFYREERVRVGKDPDSGFAVRRELLLDEDADKARAMGHEYRARASHAYGQYAAPDQTGVYKHLEGRSKADEVANESYIFGDPEMAVRELQKLKDLGYGTVILRLQWYDLPQEQVLKTLTLFREQVLPELQ